jgi:hypothetical protein
LSSNNNLKHLVCFDNALTSLNIINNTKLKYLSIAYNKLVNLDIKENIILQDLVCNNNQLTSLNTANNSSLQYLNCSTNQITRLNISENNFLQNLYCEVNQLTVLNLNNDNNHILNNFNSSSNFNLNCIQVDNVAISDANTRWITDPGASYSSFCVTASTVSKNLLNKIRLSISKHKEVNVKTLLNINFKLYNLNGKELLEGNFDENSTTLNLNRFSNGLYIFRLMYKNLKASKRFILF